MLFTENGYTFFLPFKNGSYIVTSRNILRNSSFCKRISLLADPFTRGASAEASAGAITCVSWCNTSERTPLQSLSTRQPAAALVASSCSLVQLRETIAPVVFRTWQHSEYHPRLPKGLSFALKTDEAIRGGRQRS